MLVPPCYRSGAIELRAAGHCRLARWPGCSVDRASVGPALASPVGLSASQTGTLCLPGLRETHASGRPTNRIRTDPEQLSQLFNRHQRVFLHACLSSPEFETFSPYAAGPRGELGHMSAHDC